MDELRLKAVLILGMFDEADKKVTRTPWENNLFDNWTKGLMWPNTRNGNMITWSCLSLLFTPSVLDILWCELSLSVCLVRVKREKLRPEKHERDDKELLAKFGTEEKWRRESKTSWHPRLFQFCPSCEERERMNHCISICALEVDQKQHSMEMAAPMASQRHRLWMAWFQIDSQASEKWICYNPKTNKFYHSRHVQFIENNFSLLKKIFTDLNKQITLPTTPPNQQHSQQTNNQIPTTLVTLPTPTNKDETKSTLLQTHLIIHQPKPK